VLFSRRITESAKFKCSERRRTVHSAQCERQKFRKRPGGRTQGCDDARLGRLGVNFDNTNS
jgi:hypothetical protein